MSSIKSLKILGTGKYLPNSQIFSSAVDNKLGKPEGWSLDKFHIQSRHYASKDETSSYMGAEAIRAALAATNTLVAQDLGLIISASSISEQPIPSNAALIQKALGLGDSGIPCFDINSTCLSFLTACDVASHFISSGQYQYIAIVSSEIPSRGLNWADTSTAPLFGDGAAAVILGRADKKDSSAILGSYMQTFSSGAYLCQIKGGGTNINPASNSIIPEDYMFKMDGRSIYKLAAKKLTDFVEQLFDNSGISVHDIDVFISHQASHLALKHLHKKLGFPESKIINILETHGNQVAASIPTTLHESIITQRLERGKIALLLGTAAGLSLAGMVLRY